MAIRSRSTAGGRYPYLLKLALLLFLTSLKTKQPHIIEDRNCDLNNLLFSELSSGGTGRANILYLSFLFTKPDCYIARSGAHYLTLNLSIYKSSLLNLNPPNKNTWIFLLLILSGDIEVNPGPTYQTQRPNTNKSSTKFPCGICLKPCKWGHKAIQCDQCDVWYHNNCAFVTTYHYDILANCSLSWCCFNCGLPNFSSKLFYSSTDFSSIYSHNRFNILSEDDSRSLGSDSSDNIDNLTKSRSKFTKKKIDKFSPKFKPGSSSTPVKNKKQQSNKTPQYKNNIKCLVINFRSLFGKRAEVSNLITSHDADVIIGSETWLKPDIKNSELLIDDFDIYRCDRTETSGGGCMVAVKKCLTSEFIFKGKVADTVFCKINIKGNKTIIIGAVYRPTNNNLDICNNICEDISSVMNKNKNSILWLGGDFNLPDIDWKHEDIVKNQYIKTIN